MKRKSKKPVNEDRELLRTPPLKEREDFTKKDPWRALRILGEVVEGFENLHEIHGAVAIFGSARTEKTHPYFEAARKTARMHGTPIYVWKNGKIVAQKP